MRKLARLLPLGLLLLPGCIFNVTDDGWYDDDEHRPSYEQRLSQLDRRVRDLESCMATCSADCCKEKDAPKEASKDAKPTAEVQEIHAPAKPK